MSYVLVAGRVGVRYVAFWKGLPSDTVPVSRKILGLSRLVELVLSKAITVSSKRYSSLSISIA